MNYGGDEEHYGFDGMYCNLDTLKSDAEEEAEEQTKVEAQKQAEETKKKLEKRFLASLLTFESNLSIRNHLVKKILINGEKKMIRNYTKREKLPQKYSLVAEQNNGLEILIKNFLKQIARIELNEKVRTEVQHLIHKIYENKENHTAYQRVALVRSYIYKAVENKYGSGMGYGLPVHPTKCILSASRLHLNLFDIRKNNLDYLKSQIILNDSYYNIEMNTPLLSIHKDPNKKKTPHWKAQHMRTLLYFSNDSSTGVINSILDIDVNLDKDKYLNSLLLIVIRNNYLEELIKFMKI